MCSLMAWNACSYLSIHSNILDPFSTSKKGSQRSIFRDTNLLRAATLLARLITSLGLLGEFISKSAFIFFEVDFYPSLIDHEVQELT